MTSLNLEDHVIPDLSGKVAIITGRWPCANLMILRKTGQAVLTSLIGAASGIGLATAAILARHGATVHSLDISRPITGLAENPDSSRIHHRRCDVTSWPSLLTAFKEIGKVDLAVANAGVSQESDYFHDSFTSDGALEEPAYHVLDVNLHAVLNFVKLSLSMFKKQGPGGRLVLTSSATAYSPEQSLPVYSAAKLALIGLVRTLRSSLPHSHGASINAVAPAATMTGLLPPDLADAIIAGGAPVSTSEHVALAIIYSLTAQQDHQVEGYGRDSAATVNARGEWNGRVILTLGKMWTEVEEPIARLRNEWMGTYNADQTAFQQRLTDSRPHAASSKPESIT